MRTVSLWLLVICICSVTYLLAEKKVTNKAKRGTVTMTAIVDEDQRDAYERQLKMIITRLGAMIRKRYVPENIDDILKKYESEVQLMWANVLINERSFNFAVYHALSMIDQVEAMANGKPDERPYQLGKEFLITKVNEFMQEMDGLLLEVDEKSIEDLKPRLYTTGMTVKLLKSLWFLDSDLREDDWVVRELIENLTTKNLDIRAHYQDEEGVREWFNTPNSLKPSPDNVDAARELRAEEVAVLRARLSPLEREIFEKIGGFDRMIVLYLDGECMIFTVKRRDHIITYECEYFDDF